MIKYSTADSDDLEEVTDLYFNIFDNFLKKINFKISKKQLRDVLYLYLISARKGFIVAKEDNKIVGFMITVNNTSQIWSSLLFKIPHKLALFIFSERAPLIVPPYLSYWSSGRLVAEGISEDYRGKGIGKELANRSIEYLRSQKVKKAIFETLRENRPVIKLYEKLGFNIVREVKHRGLEWVILSKSL